MNRETVMSLLERADQGQLMEDAREALRNVVHDVATYGGKGEIILKLVVKEIKGKDAQEIVPELVIKRPTPPRMSTPYFVTPDDGLTRKHGSQPDLPLAPEHDPETGEINEPKVTKLRG